MAEEPSDVLNNYAEIGRFLGMSEREAEHEATSGRIPTFKLPGGRKVRARRSTLTVWLADLEAAAMKEHPHG